MATVHRAVPDFWKAFHALPEEIRLRAEKQFSLLRTNPEHPSLQFKKIGMRHGHAVWSARVTLNYRALAIQRDEEFLWFWIGGHKTYDSLLS